MVNTQMSAANYIIQADFALTLAIVFLLLIGTDASSFKVNEVTTGGTEKPLVLYLKQQQLQTKKGTLVDNNSLKGLLKKNQLVSLYIKQNQNISLREFNQVQIKLKTFGAKTVSAYFY